MINLNSKSLTKYRHSDSNIMPVPKQRHNTARKGRRRAGQVVKIKNIVNVQSVKCSNCNTQTMPHRACSACGFYKGKEVVKIKQPKKTKK